MNIVYAAEKHSIARLLADHTRCPVAVSDINVTESPDETGTFRIDWRFRRFVLRPDGRIDAAPLGRSA
ncbi:MAG: hypothetical protein AAGC71_12610 [Pseudomonadota bacterium]